MRGGGGAPASDPRFSDVVRWYLEVRDDLVRLGSRLTRDADVAEDLVETVFVRLLERVDRGASPTVSYEFFRVAVRNAARDRSERARVRRAARHSQRAQLHGRRVRTPLEELEDLLQQERLDEAQRRLSPRLRRAFELVERRGLSAAEAAEVMGVTPATIRKHVRRASRRMAASLEEAHKAKGREGFL